jgi:Domain of unknown function (DUF4157)
MSSRASVTAQATAVKSATAVNGALLQRQCACGQHAQGGECEECKQKQMALERHRAGHAEPVTVPPIVYDVLSSPGQPLEPATRAFMEPRFGRDFSRVRVHTDEKAGESARAVKAVAYTVGENIAFDAGRYSPGTQHGRYLLAHELAHVAQQSAHSAARLDRSSITKPDDPSEREADRVGAAVADGRSFPAQTRSPLTLARQPDAGVADAGSAAPKPQPAPPAKAKAPVAAPSAVFGKVAFDARADRIPPTKTVNVAATLTGIPAGQSAKVDVEGSGGSNGTATVTAGASLAGSGNITVKGGTQTAPAHAGNLKLRAALGGAVVGRSAGFTVAAWPIDFTDTLNSDVDAGGAVGVSVQDGWSGDGSGPIAELDQVEITERVDLQSRDNPPFTVVGAISAAPAGGQTSGYLRADALTTDTHTYAKADIKTTGLAAGPWRLVYGQLSLFKCKRTGVVDVVMPASGLTITHVVWRLPFIGWTHQAFKDGASLTVEGRNATAARASVSSQLHKL